MTNADKCNKIVDEIETCLYELRDRLHICGVYQRASTKEIKRLTNVRKRIRHAITAYGMDWTEFDYRG